MTEVDKSRRSQREVCVNGVCLAVWTKGVACGYFETRPAAGKVRQASVVDDDDASPNVSTQVREFNY